MKTRRVLWRDVAEDVVHVTTGSKWAEFFREVVHHVEFGVNVFEDNQVTFYPFAEYIVFNIHMVDAVSWLSGVGHSSTGIIILICNRCCTLWNSEVPENTLTEENYFPTVGRVNIFGLCG